MKALEIISWIAVILSGTVLRSLFLRKGPLKEHAVFHVVFAILVFILCMSILVIVLMIQY